MIIGENEEQKARVVIVVEGGSRQLIGVYDKDADVPAHTGTIKLLNPLQFVNADPRATGGDGFAMMPLVIALPIDEMLVDVTSIIEVDPESKVYRKYFQVGEALYQAQRAAAAGLTVAQDLPKGGAIIGG